MPLLFDFRIRSFFKHKPVLLRIFSFSFEEVTSAKCYFFYFDRSGKTIRGLADLRPPTVVEPDHARDRFIGLR